MVVTPLCAAQDNDVPSPTAASDRAPDVQPTTTTKSTTAQQQVTLPLLHPRPATTDQLIRFASLPGTTMTTAIEVVATDAACVVAVVGAAADALPFPGIGISAVNNAVLRGGVTRRLPATIVNEHPVTIYPGPPMAAASSTSASGGGGTPPTTTSTTHHGGGSGGHAATNNANNRRHNAHANSNGTSPSTLHHQQRLLNFGGGADGGSTESDTGAEPNDNRIETRCNGLDGVVEQKLSKLFASVLRTSAEEEAEADAAAAAAKAAEAAATAAASTTADVDKITFVGRCGAITGSGNGSAGKLITLQAVFSQSARMQRSSSNNNHHQMSNCGGFDAAADEIFAGTDADGEATGDEAAEFEEFSDDSLDEVELTLEPHSSLSPSMASSLNSLPPPPASMQQPRTRDDPTDGDEVDGACAATTACDRMPAALGHDIWVRHEDRAAARVAEAKQAASSPREAPPKTEWPKTIAASAILSATSLSGGPADCKPTGTATAAGGAPNGGARIVQASDRLCKTNSMFVASIRVPFTRHSIDLGGGNHAAPSSAAVAALHPPAAPQPQQPPPPADRTRSPDHHQRGARTRLSLDLASPSPPPPLSAAYGQPPSHTTRPSSAYASGGASAVTSPAGAAVWPDNNNAEPAAVLSSPRYPEFAKYKSASVDPFVYAPTTHDGGGDQRPSRPRSYGLHQQQQQANAINSGSVGSSRQPRGGGEQLTTEDRHQADALMRIASLPSISPAHSGEQLAAAASSAAATPRRELAPPLEEEEEREDSERDVPLRHIENNISALLRGDIAVAREPEGNSAGRRPSINASRVAGVHKSESAKEMLLSQYMFGPLPPSPPATMYRGHEDSYGFPPLPPLPPIDHALADGGGRPTGFGSAGGCPPSTSSNSFSASLAHSRVLNKPAVQSVQRRESAGAGGHSTEHPPSIPPHRGATNTAMKTRSMDTGISRGGGSHRAVSASSQQLLLSSSSTTSPSQYAAKSHSYDKHGSMYGCSGVAMQQQQQPPLPPPPLSAGASSSTTARRRVLQNGFPKRMVQSPRDEQSRLQTSLSLPETPIFASRNSPDVYTPGGSRTAPRQQQSTGLNTSVIGIGNTYDNRRNRLLHHQVGGEMLRLAGGPARGWYPRQRQQQQQQQQQQQLQHHHHQLYQTQQRPLSSENLESGGGGGRSARFWDGDASVGGGARKPLTLPPNLSPKFFHKSPRDALRRVTSLLIRKGDQRKEGRDADASINRNMAHLDEVAAVATPPKKKGFFKSFWKKSKHISINK